MSTGIVKVRHYKLKQGQVSYSQKISIYHTKITVVKVNYRKELLIFNKKDGYRQRNVRQFLQSA